MKTVKVRFHHDDPGNCKTTFKEVGKNKYFNRLDGGGWYTVYPSGGYWESCDSVKNDVVFEVVDFKGNVLFTESNSNLGAFMSLSHKANEVAKKFAAKLRLTSHDLWKKWLLDEMDACGYKGYDSNWLYFETKIIPGAGIGEEHGHPLEEYSHLGIDYIVRGVSYGHKLCGKKWIRVGIYAKNDNACAAICGYILGNDVRLL